MKPADRIAKALRGSTPAAQTGVVLSANGSALSIRTVRGVIDARSVDGVVYRAGEEVLIRDGIVRGRVKAAADVPVYFV